MLLLSFVGAAWVTAPLWIAIVLGCVMAISVHRPFRALCRELHGRASWAAIIVTLVSGLVLAIAGGFIIVALANELVKLVQHLNQHQTGSLEGVLGSKATNTISKFGVDTERLYAWAQHELAAAASAAAGAAAVVLRTAGFAFLGLIVALVSMFYMLVDGPELARRIQRVLPLEPRHTQALLTEARDVGRTAFIGTLLTAVVQGILGGIGYVILGVPQPITWALATALASFLPIIGTLIVWVPIAGFLLIDGHVVRAIILIAYGILIITSLADYVIRPWLVGKGGQSHPLLTLVALLGGIEVFGLAGLIVAPILMSLFVAAFRIYEREVRRGEVPGAKTPAMAVEAEADTTEPPPAPPG